MPHTPKQGFTLIELLVVVLIIGILSSVALPQYQKSVEKSKAAQAFAMIRTVAAAQEAYHLANGGYATTFDELAVDIPWTGHTAWAGSSSNSPDRIRSNEDWSLQLYHETAGEGVSIGRLSGKYAGAGFIYFLQTSTPRPTHTLICMERKDNGEILFSQPQGSYCQKLFPNMLFWNNP